MPEVSDFIANQFLAHGIEPGRLSYLGHEATTAAHLARYHQVDIALDTYPYNGTTSTCEALWMGVPVISRCGKIHAARAGASILTSLKQTGWMADSNEAFVRIAVDLAADPSKLFETRINLRNQMNTSPITDAAGFARRFEAALRQMWRGYCDQR